MSCVYATDLGRLYHGDCVSNMREMEADSIDVVFADPPFNLGKAYGSGITDRLPDAEYIRWTRAWVNEAVRVLRPGGSIFIYNLPRWCVLSSAMLMARGLPFRNWIAIKTQNSPPIAGRLYPAHYGLIWHTKGRGRVFRRIRTPIEVCRHCGKDIKDYGGHKKELHPHGITLGDVWSDIPPVCHRSYKPEARGRTNAISTKIVERCVQMASDPGDVVLDPFGGSGTTYAVCERLKRRWIGFERGSCDAIIERLSGGVRHHNNTDIVEGA